MADDLPGNPFIAGGSILRGLLAPETFVGNSGDLAVRLRQDCKILSLLRALRPIWGSLAKSLAEPRWNPRRDALDKILPRLPLRAGGVK